MTCLSESDIYEELGYDDGRKFLRHAELDLETLPTGGLHSGHSRALYLDTLEVKKKEALRVRRNLRRQAAKSAAATR